jgi:hypothetical protein
VTTCSRAMCRTRVRPAPILAALMALKGGMLALQWLTRPGWCSYTALKSVLCGVCAGLMMWTELKQCHCVCMQVYVVCGFVMWAVL